MRNRDGRLLQPLRPDWSAVRRKPRLVSPSWSATRQGPRARRDGWTGWSSGRSERCLASAPQLPGANPFTLDSAARHEASTVVLRQQASSCATPTARLLFVPPSAVASTNANGRETLPGAPALRLRSTPGQFWRCSRTSCERWHRSPTAASVRSRSRNSNPILVGCARSRRRRPVGRWRERSKPPVRPRPGSLGARRSLRQRRQTAWRTARQAQRRQAPPRGRAARERLSCGDADA